MTVIEKGTIPILSAFGLAGSACLNKLDERWTNLRAGPKLLSEREAHEMVEPLYAWWIDQHRDEPSQQAFWRIDLGENLWPRRPPAGRFNRTWVLRSSKRRQIRPSVLGETWRSGAPTKLMPC
ncbi:hypothetical protein [Methylorubrum extorquens]